MIFPLVHWPQHSMPHRRSNEADNLHATTQSASIPDMSDPESFACYYSKKYPPEVRRALERNPNFGHAGKEYYIFLVCWLFNILMHDQLTLKETDDIFM